MALEQIPQSRPRWRGAADPEPQRLQDRQSHDPLAHQPPRTGSALHRLRVHTVFRRRQRSHADAPGDGGDAGPRDRRHPCGAEGRARLERDVSSALADDRAAVAEGLDRTEGDQGTQGRRILALAPGAVCRRPRQSGEPEAPRGLDAQLQTRGTVRREGQTRRRTAGVGAQGDPAHERQPARQRRAAAEGSQASRLPVVCRSGAHARRRGVREHEAARRVFARRAQETIRTVFASSARTRPRPTGCRRSTRQARRHGWPTTCPKTPTAASWPATGE